jgi:hypothetical protein
MSEPAHDLAALRTRWSDGWRAAADLWSRFTMLREPHWCTEPGEAAAEGLTSSFAMIRITDHSIVIDLAAVAALGLDEFENEVIAHEVGHHVYCPADVSDDARLLARIRRGLPTQEQHAGLVANLYADVLINDRLQRMAGLRMGELYAKIASGSSNRLWTFYMRMCEILWSYEKGTLAHGPIRVGLESDAMLGARLIRAYAGDWLKGAGRFAALCFTYVEEDGKATTEAMKSWLDMHGRKETGFPDGLTEIDPDEIDGAIHPSLDPVLSGVPLPAEAAPDADAANVRGQDVPMRGDGVPRIRYREPFEYVDLLRSAGVTLSDDDLFGRYYRERALPHLVPFPTREQQHVVEPLPEGTETWELGESIDDLDLLESVMVSRRVFPGVTSRKRVWGTTDEPPRTREPLDLYLGIDCSGSMGNPRLQTAWPIVAGTIVALSALRVGSRVQVVLSGEPGKFSSTDGFIRDEPAILRTLTGYLGTGYTFGIHRLWDTFAKREAKARPVHIVIVTDHDIYRMLGEKGRGTGLTGWEIARHSLLTARGGGTYVLNMLPSMAPKEIEQMEGDGWRVHCVRAWEDVVPFARAFSRATFGRRPAKAATS